jgi:hypothetical protein
MRMTVDHQAFKEWYYPLYDSDKFIEYIESADYYGLAKLAFLEGWKQGGAWNEQVFRSMSGL